MSRICFITNELFPFEKGGIGRMMYNFQSLAHEAGGDHDITYLMPPRPKQEEQSVKAALAGIATVRFCPKVLFDVSEIGKLFESQYIADWQYPHAARDSLMYYEALRHMEAAGETFDYIEFPDFGGVATLSIEAKRAGQSFIDTVLAVRIHSTRGMITATEKYYHEASNWFGAHLDLERHNLKYADRIISHIPAIAELNRVHYGFDDAWTDKVHIEFPPISFDDELFVSEGHASDRTDPDFVFSSRLQPFKRPDLFVRAAIMFLENTPDYTGNFNIVSYGWDKDYIKRLERLVPHTFEGKIRFLHSLSPAERIRHIRGNIAVIPSDYESLCLFAYEASHMDCRVILNGRCAAFGAYERWRDGDNCLLFDGTAQALCDAMERALDWSPRSKVDITHDRPYWMTPPAIQNTEISDTAVSDSGLPSLAIVGYGFNNLQAVQQMALEEDGKTGAGVTLYFAVNKSVCKSAADRHKLMEQMGHRLIWMSGQILSAEELAERLSGLDEDLVCLLPAPSTLEPGYIDCARKSFARNPGLDAFGAYSRLLSPRSHAAIGLRMYAGECPTVALKSQEILPRGAVFNRNSLLEAGFDDRANGHWFEEISRRLAVGGSDILVAPFLGINEETTIIRERSNTLLDASLYDHLGMDMGSKARLLGLKTSETVERTYVTDQETRHPYELKSVHLCYPVQVALPNELVTFRWNRGDLLLHPHADYVVIARLPALLNDQHRHFCANVMHTGKNDQITEMAMLLARPDLSIEEMASIEEDIFPVGAAFSGWKQLMPGEKKTLTAGLETAPSHHVMYLMARPADGHKTAYAWTTVRKIWSE